MNLSDILLVRDLATTRDEPPPNLFDHLLATSTGYFLLRWDGVWRGMGVGRARRIQGWGNEVGGEVGHEVCGEAGG